MTDQLRKRDTNNRKGESSQKKSPQIIFFYKKLKIRQISRWWWWKTDGDKWEKVKSGFCLKRITSVAQFWSLISIASTFLTVFHPSNFIWITNLTFYNVLYCHYLELKRFIVVASLLLRRHKAQLLYDDHYDLKNESLPRWWPFFKS